METKLYMITQDYAREQTYHSIHSEQKKAIEEAQRLAKESTTFMEVFVVSELILETDHIESVYECRAKTKKNRKGVISTICGEFERV